LTVKPGGVRFDTVLRARLLGALEVELDGTVIDSAASHRPWALFGYLALASRPVARSELANTFWPDVLDQSARASLRSALWSLRRQLGDSLVVDGDRIGLRDEGSLWVDAREFERLAGSDPRAALELCRGELLEGLEGDWAHLARERHRERVLALLEQMAHDAEQRDDYQEALALTRRQIERDPFDEQAHQRLIVRLEAAGDRAAAIRTYRALAERLRRELGVAPSSSTRELVERLTATAAPATGIVQAAAPAGLLPLIGRDRELHDLERVWHSAKTAAGTAAVIRGEAGIGKTRLAAELRARASASGALTASCAALDLGGTAPLSLWAEVIRELLPRLPAPAAHAAWPEDLAVLVPQLPAHFARVGAPSATIAPDLQRTRLFEAVVALLGWASECAPLLLLFEDVHTADSPSLELVAYAARRITTLRVLMLITRRDRPQSAGADRLEHALRARGVLDCEVELGPLPADRGTALARTVAPLSERDARRVVERAEGNPLLVVETARTLARGSDEIAPGLRGSVRSTVSSLDGDARRLVEIAAVAARPLDPVLTRALGLDDADEASAEALETGLLESVDAAVGFRHALLREAVYAEIAPPRRRGLHQAWAMALLTAEEAGAIRRPAEAARHLRLAGDDVHALPQLLRAAAEARGVAALDQAVCFVEEALTIAPDRPQLWLELGELEAWRGRREPAEAAFDRATALLQGAEPLERARALLCRARAYHGPICVPRAVLDSARTALELIDLAGRPAEEERSEALAAWAWAEAVAGRVEEAERLLAELSRLAYDRDGLRTYDAGHARALALMRRGRFVESYAPSIAAGEAIAQAGRPDLAYGCWANAASAATAAGEPERALEFIDRGVAAIAGQGLRSLEIHLLAARSFVLRGRGRLAEARRAAETERTLAEEVGAPELVAMARHDLGLGALEAGDYDTAVTMLRESLVPGAPISRPMTRLALAEALARTGQPDVAAEELRETVLEPVRPSDFPEALVPRLARVQGLIALARDDPGEARRRLEESIAGWERLLARTIRADSITSVLADLGRPVVGLVEPERELERARADLELMTRGGFNASIS
jgi:DNA-binding SARP family transcriptional activator